VIDTITLFVIPVCRGSGESGTHKLERGRSGLTVEPGLDDPVFMGPGLALTRHPG
jgi:hypothetical protein